MAKIYAPNKQYTGISAGVPFAAGVGESDNPTRLAWFREHGYEVEEPTPPAEASEPPAEPKQPTEPVDTGKKAAAK